MVGRAASFVVACLALLLAAGGTAYGTVQATGSAVNVVDPTHAAQIAKVDASGRLLVGDGAGNLTIDGTVDGVGRSQCMGDLPSAVDAVQIYYMPCHLSRSLFGRPQAA